MGQGVVVSMEERPVSARRTGTLRTVDPQFGKFLQQRLGLNTLGDGGQSVFPGDEDDGLHDAFVLAILGACSERS